ncbi:hypothetical protein AB205_0033900 [Aquarana catesbeiana]|uniref:C2H2-type domain-containing protein n=1 Tax=Aquarana catesbeiana TaxID=8400 RepID=A0A2G9SKN2_AQUCT|nr:hypothetical protein AB205_0033900 [Aquarana catesbeiana]
MDFIVRMSDRVYGALDTRNVTLLSVLIHVQSAGSVSLENKTFLHTSTVTQVSIPSHVQKVTVKGTLIIHQRIYMGERPYSYTECGKCFVQKDYLLKYQKIHIGERPYSCSECGKCFIMKGKLLEHQKIQTGEHLFSCLECGKCFIMKRGLLKHQTIHTGSAGKVSLGKIVLIDTRRFTWCGKCFTLKNNLIRHQKLHTGERPIHVQCRKCFFQKNYLLKHLRMHMGERPFPCSECGKCFTFGAY